MIPCTGCGREFANAKGLANHCRHTACAYEPPLRLRGGALLPTGPCECDVCGTGYSTVRGLDYHRRMTHGIRSVSVQPRAPRAPRAEEACTAECPDCGRYFVPGRGFTYHRRKCSGELPAPRPRPRPRLRLRLERPQRARPLTAAQRAELEKQATAAQRAVAFAMMDAVGPLDLRPMSERPRVRQYDEPVFISDTLRRQVSSMKTVSS